MSQNTPLAAIRLQLEQLRVRLRQQLLRDLLHGVPPVGNTLEEHPGGAQQLLWVSAAAGNLLGADDPPPFPGKKACPAYR